MAYSSVKCEADTLPCQRMTRKREMHPMSLVDAPDSVSWRALAGRVTRQLQRLLERYRCNCEGRGSALDELQMMACASVDAHS